jgi:ketosteroid isomerase-like protein
MSNSVSNLDKARRYLKAIEDGDPSFIADVFAADACVDQMPNRIYPKGLRANVSQMAEGFEKGRKIFARQTYKITSEVVSDNVVALEVLWTGKLAITFGALAAGSEMRCRSAMFMEFRDGKIVAQRNYDCFDPW